jgi:PAS domain S-box-containing protein
MNEKHDSCSGFLSAVTEYAVCQISVHGKVLSWNKGAELIFGYNRQEAVGKELSFLYSPEQIDKNQPYKDLEKAREQQNVEYYSWTSKADGTSLYLHTSLTATYDDENRLTGYVRISRDATAAKQLEGENYLLHNRLEALVEQRTKQLAVANEELEAFSYSVSHDLRAPLRAISGFADMFKEKYGASLDNEARRILSTILENGRMMGRLIDDLLAFSRMGRLVAISETVNMNELVQMCVKQIGIQESTVSVAALPVCKGDPNMLRQVWMNLIDNAHKYSSKTAAAYVEIGFQEKDAFIVYYVKDNGVGFDMNYYPKLFGVFQRLHRHDEFEGTGLGLALAKRIIAKHGGEIWGTAQPDNGATFYFSLPKS